MGLGGVRGWVWEVGGWKRTFSSSITVTPLLDAGAASPLAICCGGRVGGWVDHLSRWVYHCPPPPPPPPQQEEDLGRSVRPSSFSTAITYLPTFCFLTAASSPSCWAGAGVLASSSLVRAGGLMVVGGGGGLG